MFNLFNPNTKSGKPVELVYDYDSDTAWLTIETRSGQQYRLKAYGGTAQSLLRQVKKGVGVIVVQCDPDDPTIITSYYFS